MTLNDYVIEQWEKHFVTMDDIAIYGTGKIAGAIVENFSLRNVLAFMDEVQIGGHFHGKPIVSLNEAVELGAKTVVIAAHLSNVKIIYRRIALQCKQDNISVYDINGKKVSNEVKSNKTFEKYNLISREELKGKIRNADVVSFDVFDTLITRRTLYPRDIFEILEKQNGKGFFQKRVNVEQGFYLDGKHPTIYDIYNKLEDFSPETEVELESEFLAKRKSMAEMLDYARKQGKQVFLLSDMYLPKEIIKNLLDNLSIDVPVDNIMVSCDYGASKSGGLYDFLRLRVGDRKILHIGDNYEADIKSATKYGIDDTFHIESGLVMLEDSFAQGLLELDTTLPNRMLIGEFVSTQLNDPFLFSESKGKFVISDVQEMAYSYLAPLLYSFFGWIVISAKKLGISRILLASRDGHLVRRIYDSLMQKTDLPEMVYFYTSRAVAALAGVTNDDDILHASQINFAGNVREILKLRFKLSDSELIKQSSLSDDEYVLLHRTSILKHAEDARCRYSAYIDSLKIKRGEKVGFMDFMSSGTCQKGLSNFVNFDLNGFYFAYASTGDVYKSDLKVNSMFGVSGKLDKAFSETTHSMENSVLLENIMTSCEPTLKDFDECGKPLFFEEYRSDYQIESINKIHDAIIEYVSNSKLSLNDVSEADPRVSDFLISLLHTQYSNATSFFDSDYVVVDEFQNRILKISELTS